LFIRKNIEKKIEKKINQKIREWYYKNKDRVRANQRIYEREGAYRNSLHFKIKDGMRKRILEVLKRDGGKKNTKNYEISRMYGRRIKTTYRKTI
jgi:hypothetical protein